MGETNCYKHQRIFETDIIKQTEIKEQVKKEKKKKQVSLGQGNCWKPNSAVGT